MKVLIRSVSVLLMAATLPIQAQECSFAEAQLELYRQMDQVLANKFEAEIEVDRIAIAMLLSLQLERTEDVHKVNTLIQGLEAQIDGNEVMVEKMSERLGQLP